MSDAITIDATEILAGPRFPCLVAHDELIPLLVPAYDDAGQLVVTVEHFNRCNADAPDGVGLDRRLDRDDVIALCREPQFAADLVALADGDADDDPDGDGETPRDRLRYAAAVAADEARHAHA